MSVREAIQAAERLVRELRFHAETPRPDRILHGIIQLRLELDRVERDLRAE